MGPRSMTQVAEDTQFGPVTSDDLNACVHHVYLDEAQRIIFFTIPKVACSEWAKLFRRMSGLPNWADDPHYQADRPLLSTLSPDQATSSMNDPTWTHAVFLRDPAERLLSAYLDKFVRDRHYRMTIFGEPGRRLSPGSGLGTLRKLAQKIALCLVQG